MIIKPKIRHNICINAHPVGCAAQVRAQINYVRKRAKIEGPKKVLIIGSEQTRPLYRDGTIGAAKKDLEQKATDINTMLAAVDGKALISINKALITRASAVIPAVPLYIALRYRVMKAKKLHEGCIQQTHRLYHEFLFSGDVLKQDARGRVRLDDWEMRPDVQNEVRKLWQEVDQDNISYPSP
jgi:enoyl-[acyl-carrier protein] reductase/trans-2-enoyl-CoA reductase (NAD+)